MHEEMNPYADPSDNDPSPEEPTGARRRTRIGRLPKAALTGGVIAGLALGGTGVGFAFASGSSTPASAKSAASSATTTTVPGKGKQPFPGGFGPGGRFGRLGGPAVFGPGFGGGAVVHGQFTVRSGTGYKTEDVQTGSVTKVGSMSITVSSTDGYSQTYTVVGATIVDAKSGGIGSVSAKDDVTITATEEGKTLTATNIEDTTAIKNSHGAFGFGPMGGNRPAGPAPGAPSSTSAA